MWIVLLSLLLYSDLFRIWLRSFTHKASQGPTINRKAWGYYNLLVQSIYVNYINVHDINAHKIFADIVRAIIRSSYDYCLCEHFTDFLNTQNLVSGFTTQIINCTKRPCIKIPLILLLMSWVPLANFVVQYDMDKNMKPSVIGNNILYGKMHQNIRCMQCIILKSSLMCASFYA